MLGLYLQPRKRLRDGDNCTGAAQTYTVPAGVTRLGVAAQGGGGTSRAAVVMAIVTGGAGQVLSARGGGGPGAGQHRPPTSGRPHRRPA